MSDLNVYQAIKLATDTYPDMLNNPVTKANFRYASEEEQAAFVIEKLLNKLKCRADGNESTTTTSSVPGTYSIRKSILEAQNKLVDIDKEKAALMDAVVETQSKLIDLQAKKMEKQKEEIKLYQESENNLYDMLKEYMPEEDYESFISGEGI